MEKARKKYLSIDPKLGLNYFPPTENPLSANVTWIEGSDAIWIYDVGADPEILCWAKKQKKPLCVILSHFHPDHSANLTQMELSRLFVGKNTYRYLHRGQIVEEELYIHDGRLQLHVFPLPSSHAKGSLGLEINETYCFIGDAAYATRKNGKTVYNAGLLQQQIKILEALPAKFLLLSHAEPFLKPKQEVLSFLTELYAGRKSNQPYIEV